MGTALSTGDVVAGTYVLGEPLGSGGMGVVYEARLGNGHTVAIKLLHPDHASDLDAVRRIRTEAIAARYVSHPNVVAVLDCSESEAALPFIVMERIRGESLGEVVRTNGLLPLRQASELGRQILAGLDAAHSAGVVHADIKSDNILVEPRPAGREHAKIIDFGLASIHRVDHPATVADHDQHGRLLMSGTPEYMAPEVIRGEGAIAASDLYAVGVVIYEMITGKTPFATGSSSETIQRHLHDAVVLPSLRRPDRFIPFALERTVMRALEKDPALRFPSAKAFAAALLAATPPIDEPVAPEPVESAFSSEARTRDFPVPGANFAVGTRPGTEKHVQTLRDDLASAMQRGAVDRVVVTSLELARALVDNHCLSSAVRELERVVHALTHGTGILATDAPAALWRVLLTLAALYQGLGDPMRARRAATAAHNYATLHGSDVGRERAATLLDRLQGRPRRR